MRPVLRSDENPDPSELRFRTDSVPAGVWVTFIVCAAGVAYVAGWTNRHESAIALLIGTGAIGGGLILALPWERIVRSRQREVVFAAWSLLDLGLIVALAAYNGGGDSVFATLLVIPIVFAGLSYPRWLVIAISVAAVISYVVLALVTHTNGGYTLMLAATLACTALMTVWQARNHERRRELLALASRTDPLTGSLNRRGYQQAAASMLAAVGRFGHPMSLVLLDLDHFKAFNDSHGHAAGDELLCWTVDRVGSSLRPTDAIARMGGDEFAILLAGADHRAADTVIRRIREDLGVRVQTSCGVAAAPEDGTTIDELYSRADAALYEAKRQRPADPVIPRPRST